MRTREHFRRLYAEGRAFRSSHLVLIFRPSDEGHARYGVVASRKVGGAVARNRAKRILRVAVRALIDRQRGPNGVDLALIARSGISACKSQHVVDEALGLAQAARILISPGARDEREERS